MTAREKLFNKVEQDRHICIGLDTDINKIPDYLKGYENPVVEFNKIIIENTSHLIAGFKINFAFYEKDGVEGMRNLQRTVELIPEDVLIIGDAKRGDIGNTSKMYAKSLFDYFNMVINFKSLYGY